MNVVMLLATAPQSCVANADGGIIGTITAWLVEVMNAVGAVGVMIAIALESVFPPIPSEIILPLAGFSAAGGNMSLPIAIAFSTLGSVLGAWILYGIAYWIGIDRIRSIAARIPGVSGEDIDKANRWFTKYSTFSVLIGRCIPVVRSLISIPAGLDRMNLLVFTVLTSLGSAVWNTMLVGAGYMLGDRWCSILSVLDVFESIVLVIIGIVLVLLIIRWIINLRKRTSASSSIDAGRTARLAVDTVASDVVQDCTVASDVLCADTVAADHRQESNDEAHHTGVTAADESTPSTKPDRR